MGLGMVAWDQTVGTPATLVTMQDLDFFGVAVLPWYRGPPPPALGAGDKYGLGVVLQGLPLRHSWPRIYRSNILVQAPTSKE